MEHQSIDVQHTGNVSNTLMGHQSINVPAHWVILGILKWDTPGTIRNTMMEHQSTVVASHCGVLGTL